MSLAAESRNSGASRALLKFDGSNVPGLPARLACRRWAAPLRAAQYLPAPRPPTHTPMHACIHQHPHLSPVIPNTVYGDTLTASAVRALLNCSTRLVLVNVYREPMRRLARSAV